MKKAKVYCHNTFVQLTRYEEGNPIFINRYRVDYVSNEKLSPISNEHSTVISFAGGSVLTVKESVEKALELIENGNEYVDEHDERATTAQ